MIELTPPITALNDFAVVLSKLLEVFKKVQSSALAKMPLPV